MHNIVIPIGTFHQGDKVGEETLPFMQGLGTRLERLHKVFVRTEKTLGKFAFGEKIESCHTGLELLPSAQQHTILSLCFKGDTVVHCNDAKDGVNGQ